MTNDFISKYNVKKFNFSDEEKFILEELRENLIDLAIQEKMSSFNEDLILFVFLIIACKTDLIMNIKRIWLKTC